MALDGVDSVALDPLDALDVPDGCTSEATPGVAVEVEVETVCVSIEGVAIVGVSVDDVMIVGGTSVVEVTVGMMSVVIIVGIDDPEMVTVMVLAQPAGQSVAVPV